ncbi:hypothetical protein Pmani_023710 [Petrolisthes manimaculis]|uniref:Uncharacterized protein n=1 Tax=Petrolisthes manimaculis TaxID=1843537 RepID=A0AAE1PBG6_9EUCA|nr:hypothetical protein Pmani_023710 [Petrolisthes manimaculis]
MPAHKRSGKGGRAADSFSLLSSTELSCYALHTLTYSAMAIIGSTKKTSVFSIHSLKKAIKNLIKKTRTPKDKKKVQDKAAVYKVDFEAEIEDNLANEALEARFIQIIEASPAAIDLNFSLKGSLVLASPPLDVQFGTFWTTDDDDAAWALCKDMLATSPPIPVSPPATTQA